MPVGVNHQAQNASALVLRFARFFGKLRVGIDKSTRGGVTPMPGRKTPPPMPPPLAGAYATAVAGPTPPPEPEPMPLPDPVPFDGITAVDFGSPRFGMLFMATLISGGTITVGSTANLGFGFRITAAGGVICCIENFGKRPCEPSAHRGRRHRLRRRLASWQASAACSRRDRSTWFRSAVWPRPW